MQTLTELANKYASDKGTISPPTGHHGPRLHFTPVYEKFFDDIRYYPLTLLEIGVGSGPSLKMWYEYFPNATIHAIDVNDESRHNNDRVTTHRGDQSIREDLERIMKEVGRVDIIIDDGSHVVSHQQISIGVLFKYLNERGQYWIEDLHTSDRDVWQGKTLYGYDMTIEDEKSTVEVIENYLESKEMKSPFLNEEENTYLTNAIEYAGVFDLPRTFYGENKLSVFVKKDI